MSEKKLLKNDVTEIIKLLSENEDGILEYSCDSELGKQLESILKRLQSSIINKDIEIKELKNKFKNQPVVTLPNSDAIQLHGNMMYSESVIRALEKAGVKYKW